tara:strand:+ start:1445 stop:5461 length:4017 start_codon:yes stop_codon:yes gene_type:complete
MSTIIERDKVKINDYARQYLSRGDENIWNQIMLIIDNYNFKNEAYRLLNMVIPIGPQDMNKSTNILFTIVGNNSKISLENPEIIIEKIKILLEKGSSLYIFDDLHLGVLYRSAYAINHKIIFDSFYEHYDYDKYNTDILDFLLEQIVFGMKNRSMFLKIYKDDLQKIYSLDEKINNEENEYIPLDNKLSVGIGSYIMGKANDLFYIKDDELKTIQSKKRLSVAKQLDPRLGKDVKAIIKDYDMMQTIMGYVDDMNLNKKDYDKFKKEEKEEGVPENLQNEYTSQYLDEYSKFGGKKYKGGINSSQNLDEELNSLVSQTNELQRQDALPLVSQTNELQRQDTLPFVDSNEYNDDSNDVFEELESELNEREKIEQLTSQQRIKGNYFFYLSAHGDLDYKTPIQYTENSSFPPEFKWYNNWYSDENTFTNLKKINLTIYKNSVCTDIVPVRAFTRGEEITFDKQKFTEYLKIIIDIKPKIIVSQIYLYNPDENNYELFYDLETGVNYNIPNINYTFNNDFSMGIVESVKISNNIFQTSPEYLYEGKTQWNPNLLDSTWTAQLLDHDTDPGFANSIIKQIINKLPNDMEEETINVTLFNSTCLNTKISNINELVETYPEWSNIYKYEVIITIEKKLKNLNIQKIKLTQNITDNNNKISKLIKEKIEIVEKIQKLDENKWELGDEMGKKEVEELQEKYIELDDEKISISNQIIIISRKNKKIEDKLENINAKINEANKQLININSNKKRRSKGGNSDETTYQLSQDESKKKTKLKGGVNTEKIFNITDEFCLFNGNILDFESPIDKTKISKVNPYENNFVQSCNEYKIGLKLKKYSEFLTADNCEVITRVKEGDDYYYDNDRDKFIFNECSDLIKDSEKIEVYVYEKSGKDLQYYFDNPLELEKLLTRNRKISIYDGINILIVYFTNILSILKSEKIIHKDIKPGNIIVGNDLHNFPRNIKIIDLGFSFQYRNLSDFILNQYIDLFGDNKLEELEKEFDTDDFSELSLLFSLDYYDKWESKYSGTIDIFNVISGVATPLYAAPDYDLRLKTWMIKPTIGSLIIPDYGSDMLGVNENIPKYIIKNQYSIDYTKIAELYANDNGNYNDIIKKNIIPDYFINALIDYNNKKNTNYNLFELIYLMANGLTGPEPILYKYDLYAFGLILRQLVDVYTDALKKNLLFDPRKYRARTKPKTRPTRKNTRKGGTIPKTFDYTTREHFKELDEINFVINNMINPDCIYRWTSNDLMSYYQNIEISSEKYITIKGEEYLLCSEEITKESIIKQFQIINPKLNEYIKPEPTQDSTEVNWDIIRTQLKESGLNARKIGLTITKMKKKGLTSIDQL